MRAVLCTAFEGIKSLSIGETAEPHPRPDEVLIDVYAASVSYMGYLMVSGGYQMRPPFLMCREQMPPEWSLPSAPRSIDFVRVTA
jgi:NADPH:quinone reductase-like Zn-dependent oxidoreductase